MDDTNEEWHVENCPLCQSKVLEKIDEDGTPTYLPVSRLDTVLKSGDTIINANVNPMSEKAKTVILVSESLRS